MTAVTKTILISKPLGTIWAFLNDPERVGNCLPGCQEVRVLGQSRSYWKVKVSVGIISRIIEAEAVSNVSQEKNQISYKIRSKTGDLEGDLKAILTSVEDKTQLDLNFDVKALGSFSWIINQMVGRQSDRMAEQFVHCIEATI